MKKLIPIILLAFFIGSCVTTQTNVNSNTMDLQALVEQLNTLNQQTIEVKRAAAKAILNNWVFDGGYWEVIFAYSKMRPTIEIQEAVKDLTTLALKQAPSDYDLGRALGYYTIVVAGLIKFGAQEILPQIVQLLALF